MALTFAEELVAIAIAANSPVVPIDKTCDCVITVGSTRLAPGTPQGAIGLMTTGLQGYSTKTIASVSVDPAADKSVDFGAGSKTVGFIVTISGTPQAFRPTAILLTLDSATSTGMDSTTVIVYPKANRCQFFLIATISNGGVGQPSVATQGRVTWPKATNPAALINEYTITAENVTLRDFTSRENVPVSV